ncbi:DUF7563 family protein [Haladaptatus sp. DFWS20]|uniref:DUF7563 family protein n=1 Tax=Haladaptatus sp. DFWS20 TaxID=3403467 RepID=UPI003EB8B6B8
MTGSNQVPQREVGYSDRRCRNCGSFITPDFTRVFGNNDDQVFGCFSCLSATAVKNGEARTERSARRSSKTSEQIPR